MASFSRQTYFLLYRNFLLKLRNNRQTTQEILIPLIFLGNLAIISFTIPRETYDPIPSSQLGTYPLSNFMPDGNRSLGFAPDTIDTRAVMEAAADKLNITANPKVFGFDTEDELVAAYANETYRSFDTGIVFVDDFPGNLSYTIRMPFYNVPNTGSERTGSDSCRSMDPVPGLSSYGCPANMYVYSMFTTTQVALDYAIASVVSGNSSLPFPSVWFQMFPKPEYLADTTVIRLLGSIYFVMMFSPFIAILLTNLVSEKEKKIKECMKIMGMKEPAFWVAWSITYTITIGLASVFIVGLSYAIQVFSKSNFFLLYLYFFSYGLSLVTFSFMLTPFFNKAIVAGAAGTFFTIVISLAYIPLGIIDDIPPIVQWLMCLLSPIAMALGMDKTILYETQFGGLTFDTVSIGEFPPYACLVMLIVDAVLYLLLAIYFSNVIPGTYGQRKPVLFFLLPSYWCPSRRGPSDRTHLLSDTAANGNITENVNSNADDIEAVPASVRDKGGIKIHNLMKKFPGNKRKKKPDVVAVNGITLDIYEGQITCLLGHNGAGKSTLINALTGLLTANSGDATIYGYNVNNPIEMDSIRTMTGVCSQENSLFDYLSPEEHLKVYAGLKGVPDEKIKDEVQRILKETDLDKQCATPSKLLSGGQKRKLCVGMALIGNPKVLFLDEPSSGMDPYSRRHLWSLLKKQREGRVTLLTTHFMDEADILADRKAVMNKGSLRCCGSSLFLKSKFGIGYHLGMVVEQNCDTEPITALVQSHIPDAKVARSHGMELNYTLPLTDSSNFAAVFEALEQKDKSGDSSVAMAMGVQSYGVSMTTLEEVFLKLGEEAEQDEDDAGGVEPDKKDKDKTNTNRRDGEYNNTAMNMEEDNQQDTTTVEFKESPLDSTVLATKPVETSSWVQIKSIAWILVLLALRNPATYIFRIIFPCVYFALSVVLVDTINFGGSGTTDPTSLTLDPSLYLAGVNEILDKKTVLLYKDSLPADQNISDLVSQFSNKLDTASQAQSNLSDLLSIAPHSVAVDVLDIATNAEYTALYNDTTVHALPIAINIMSNSLYSLLEALDTDQIISALSHPFPNFNVQYTFNSGFFFVIFFGFALVGVPAGFAVDLIKERQEKIRAQIRVSGVTNTTYWLAHFLVDFSQMGFICLFGIIIIAALQSPSLTQPGAMFLLVIFLLQYIPVSTLSAYSFSFAYTDFETASGSMWLFFGYVPFLMAAPVLVLDFISSGSGAAVAIHLLFCIIYPPYSLFGTLYYIDKVYQEAAIFGTVDQLTFGDYFEFENAIFPTIIVMFIPLVGLFFFLRYVEILKTGGDTRDTCPGGSSRKELKATKVNTDNIENEDSDVVSERGKVQQIYEQDVKCAVAIHSLRREFTKKTGGGMCKKETKEEKTKVAVRNMSFAVNQGEVMGLLGPNGAGKTTTLDTVIAEQEPTKGQVRVAGHDITSHLVGAFQSMGYCPQNDPLWGEITLREHLEFYALVKGIHKIDVKHISEHYMKCLKISEHADKRARQLSGGTKRKLCFAISMLGDPKIVLLDEPSSGMDPSSKRFLWNTITASFVDKRGCILTTHSMEEADAVCSRVGIMVMGQLVCLGTTQHLKDKYGGGYILEVKLKMEEASSQAQTQTLGLLKDRTEALDKYVREILPDAEVIENFVERITYKAPKKSVASLSSVFSAMEKGKESLGIEEYNFSQSTLEQVFIQFAKMQTENEEAEAAGGDPNVSYNRQASVRSLPRPQDEVNGDAAVSC